MCGYVIISPSYSGPTPIEIAGVLPNYCHTKFQESVLSWLQIPRTVLFIYIQDEPI